MVLHAAIRRASLEAEKNEMDDIVQAWPEEIVMSDEIKDLVTRRWPDYGLDTFTARPSPPHG